MKLPEDNAFLLKIDFKMQNNHSIISKMTNAGGHDVTV